MTKINDATESEWNALYHNGMYDTGKLSTPEKAAYKTNLKSYEQYRVETVENLHYDPVDKPEHYNKGTIEAIDYIKMQLGEQTVAYCEGNVLKYMHRHRYKNGVEDLKKAQWYLNRMIEEMT